MNGLGFRPALAAAVGESATAYGFTLTVWSTGASLVHLRGKPGVIEAFLFLGGAVAGFVCVEGLATHGFRRFERPQPQQGLFVAGALHLLSGGAALGVAALAASLVESRLAWPLGAFLATSVYFLLAAAQLSLASRVGSEYG